MCSFLHKVTLHSDCHTSLLKDTRRISISIFSIYRSCSLIELFISRRVHITSVTLEHLNGAYKVEDGDGQERDPYLKEHGVITFLVVNPKVP